jgi:hypothetical protein
MRSFRTSVVVATAVAALSWSGLSRAEDDVSNKKGTTTKTQGTSTTKSGTSSPDTSGTTGASGTSGQGTTGSASDTTGSSSDVHDTTSPSSTPTTPSTSTDTTWGTGSDSAYGTGYGSTTATTPAVPDTSSQQYQYQQPAQPTQTTTYSTTTTTAAAYDDRASADRAEYKYRPNRPLLFTGLGILVGTYGTSALVAAGSDRNEDKDLYVPVVGPWLNLAERDCGLGECGQREDWNQAALIGSGVLQGVGLSLAVASLFVSEDRDAKSFYKSSRATKSTAAAKPTIQLTPVNVRGGGGFGAIGTF